MKKPNSKITIISLSSFLIMLLTLPLAYAVMEEQRFVRSEFRKKVQRIERVNFAAPHSTVVECVFFTDGTYRFFNQQSVFNDSNKFVNVKVTDFVKIGDSIVKYRQEPYMRILKAKSEIEE